MYKVLCYSWLFIATSETTTQKRCCLGIKHVFEEVVYRQVKREGC